MGTQEDAESLVEKTPNGEERCGPSGATAWEIHGQEGESEADHEIAALCPPAALNDIDSCNKIAGYPLPTDWVS